MVSFLVALSQQRTHEPDGDKLKCGVRHGVPSVIQLHRDL